MKSFHQLLLLLLVGVCWTTCDACPIELSGNDITAANLQDKLDEARDAKFDEGTYGCVSYFFWNGGVTDLTIENAPNLKSFPAGFFDDHDILTYLKITNAGLTALRDGVFDRNPLFSLRLANTKLTALPDGVFDSLPDLTFLSLYGNQLTTLPDNVFTKARALGSIDLSGNQLTALPDDRGPFYGLTKLTHINLNNNKLTALPARTFVLYSLEHIWMKDNELTAVPSDLWGKVESKTSCGKLRSLWLQGNKLTSFPAGVFADCTYFESVFLEGNTNENLSVSGSAREITDEEAEMEIAKAEANQQAQIEAAKTLDRDANDKSSGNAGTKETVLAIAVVASLFVAAVSIFVVCYRRRMAGKANLQGVQLQDQMAASV